MGYAIAITFSNLDDHERSSLTMCAAVAATTTYRIAELKHDLAADDFCLQEFFATEAAFCSLLLLFNRLGKFQRACGFVF